MPVQTWPTNLSLALTLQAVAWGLIVAAVVYVIADARAPRNAWAMADAPNNRAWHRQRRRWGGLRICWRRVMDAALWWDLLQLLAFRALRVGLGITLLWLKPRRHQSLGHILVQFLDWTDNPIPATNALADRDSSPPLSPISARRRLSVNAAPGLVLGLVNVGNSCFLNSVLQALAASQHLPAYLGQVLDTLSDHNGRLQNETDWVSLPVAEALEDTLEELNQTVAENGAFRPYAMLAALASNPRLVNREQQDAHEAFQMISTALLEEDASVRLAVPSILQTHALQRLVHPASLPRQLRPPSRPMGNPLVGLLASRLSCQQCGYTAAIRHFTFDNLSLTLPLDYTSTLDQCLASYMAVEVLHDARCQRCTLATTLRIYQDRLQALRAAVEPADSTTPPCLGPGAPQSVANDLDASLSERPPSPQLPVNRDRPPALAMHATDTSTDDDDNDVSEAERNAAQWLRYALLRKRVQLLTWALQHQDYDLSSLRASLLPSEPTTAPLPLFLKALVADVDPEQLLAVDFYHVESPHSTKQVMLARPPPTLCLHLSRSTVGIYGQVVKNNCHVAFPEFLDVAPYTTNGVLQMAPDKAISVSATPPSHPALRCWYRLQAVVVHFGTHAYGHFITYRRKLVASPRPCSEAADPVVKVNLPTTSVAQILGHNDWYLVSDEQVQSVSIDRVLNANPYLLLYEQVTDASAIAYLTALAQRQPPPPPDEDPSGREHELTDGIVDGGTYYRTPLLYDPDDDPE
ncbi:ubiquitin-specific protease ubp1 [Dimargaris xerosporica]|nr:ubiquitin-specific protease ubp1 [Dimargaris xerosporica]